MEQVINGVQNVYTYRLFNAFHNLLLLYDIKIWIEKQCQQSKSDTML